MTTTTIPYLTYGHKGRRLSPSMAALRYLFHRHHLSKRMLSLINEYGGKR